MKAEGGKRYKPYPEYEDSGVEWLGKIPARWEVKPIRSLAKAGYKTFTDGDWIESPFIRDEGIRLLQTGNVGAGFYKEQGFRYLDEETFEAFRCTEVLPGDVLICRLADPVGRACLAPQVGRRMITSVDVCILKTAIDVDPAYVVYTLSGAAYLSWLGGICRGGTRDRVSRSMLGSIRVQAPRTIEEQRAIVAFLDRETARIDALRAKQERLIDLLLEKRTALITRAVTKGLDPNVPMKDSGIEWLGEIPAHWAVTPLRWALTIRSGEALPNTEFELTTSGERDVPVIGGNGVMGYGDRSNIAAACIAVGRVGALCGNVHLVDPPAWVTDNALVFTEINGFDRQYLALLLDTLDLNRWASQNAQPLITGGFVKAQRVCRPPWLEQAHIVECVGTAAKDINLLIERIGDAIALLKELRSVLISAAVTGKIDVREESA